MNFKTTIDLFPKQILHNNQASKSALSARDFGESDPVKFYDHIGGLGRPVAWHCRGEGETRVGRRKKCPHSTIGSK